MKDLNSIMLQYGSDKSVICHNYCPRYEDILSGRRNDKLVLLELGIGGEDTEPGGASIYGWQEYLPNSTIIGLDIYDKSHVKGERISVYQGSQDDSSFLKKIIEEKGVPDIIIDDASHFSNLTIASFRILFPLLKPGGYYVIEDISCSYRWDFGGSFDKTADTTMNYIYEMIEQVQPLQVADPNYKQKEEFSRIDSITISNDMIVIKKKL